MLGTMWNFQNRDNYQYLPEAIKQGLVSEATFEGAVKRVLRLKAAVGLFDKIRHSVQKAI